MTEYKPPAKLFAEEEKPKEEPPKPDLTFTIGETDEIKSARGVAEIRKRILEQQGIKEDA